MKLVFLTNFYNHHQKNLADAFFSILGDDYCFIETEPISEERLKMGWGESDIPGFVKSIYKSDKEAEECRKIVDNADVVIIGSAPYNLLVNRLKEGKLTFGYTERMYKKGCPYHKLPWHFVLNTKRYRKYKNFYLLCASAYTSADYAKTLAFIDKAYKWGYFTEVKKYDDVDILIDKKEPASILWVARLIGLKHPELPLAVAKRLREEGYNFKLRIIGIGPAEDYMREIIEATGISECVEMLGAMKPEQVREYMEKSEVFLFTSDRNEGWGAVLNESMNSACAVVASHAIGSVPFLIEDGNNGLIYKDGDIGDLYRKTKWLLDNPEERKLLAEKAYLTMVNEWNAENAATRFVLLCERMLAGEYKIFPYESGVCSKAEILKDDWKK